MVASTVTFTESRSVTLKKDNFLLNPKNKQRFLSVLSQTLQNAGCITHHANGDADLLIVKTTVDGMQCFPACGQRKRSLCTNLSNNVDYESEDLEG